MKLIVFAVSITTIIYASQVEVPAEDYQLEIPTFKASEPWGRQRLAESCTLPYRYQWIEFLGSLPYFSLAALYRVRNGPPRLYRGLVPWALANIALVETTHAFGHLLLFPYAEELIIVVFFVFNLLLANIIYDSRLTRQACWRPWVPCKAAFLAAYCGASGLLLGLYFANGYFLLTFAQFGLMLGFLLTTPMDSPTATRACRSWVLTFGLGAAMLGLEIVHCEGLQLLFGTPLPYHVVVDVTMGVAVHFKCRMLCELGRREPKPATGQLSRRS